MLRRVFPLYACFALAVVLGAVPALAAAPVALVVGNGAYVEAAPLPNPPNDARAVAAALHRLGFEVIEGYDLDKRGLEAALRRFGEKVPGADIALAFFAGHGLQVAGKNYLVPVDAKLVREQDLRYEAVPMDALLEEMQNARKVRIVVLDACRNNPFGDRMARSMGASRSAAVGRGLARVEGLGVDTLVAYATAADDIALDGNESNSPFTTALLQNIETPGLDVRLLFGRVRDSVISQTNGKQQPFIYGSLGGSEVMLKPGPTQAAANAAAASPARQTGPAAPDSSVEVAFWNSIKDSGNPADFTAYLEQYPSGAFAPLARNRLRTTSAQGQAPTPAPTPAHAQAATGQGMVQTAVARPLTPVPAQPAPIPLSPAGVPPTVAPSALSASAVPPSAMGVPAPVATAPAMADCRVGERLYAFSDDAWFASTIRGPAGRPGFCLVHFDGYSEDEDEVVTADNTRPFTADGPGLPVASCGAGVKVVAESDAVWYPATIVKGSASSCAVRYDDPDLTGESLPLTRLRTRP